MVSQSMAWHLATWFQVLIKTFVWSVLVSFLIILIVFIFYTFINLHFIQPWLQLLVNLNQLSKAKVVVTKWPIWLFLSKLEQQIILCNKLYYTKLTRKRKYMHLILSQYYQCLRKKNYIVNLHILNFVCKIWKFSIKNYFCEFFILDIEISDSEHLFTVRNFC